MGKTWHPEISDKISSVRTHVQYSLRNCAGETQKLRDMLDNVVDHYRNRHDQCQPESRCRQDPMYESSKMMLISPKAVDLLRGAIHKTVVYQHPEDFVMATDTFYVESFNNVLNLFQNKGISFGNEEYHRRSQLAVLHWNENVGRGHTSTWTPPQRTATTCRKGAKSKKSHLKKCFKYADLLWSKFITQIYEEEQLLDC